MTSEDMHASEGQHVDQRTEGTVSIQPKTLIRTPVMPMATNMRHVVQLVLPLTQFVATLSRPLSWSDFVNLLHFNSLNKHKGQTGEEAHIGLILCGESRTELSPKAELEQKLHTALLEAREKMVRRGCCWRNRAMVAAITVSNGLRFPVMVQPGLRHMPARGENTQEAARVFHVPPGGATHRLVIGMGGAGGRKGYMIIFTRPQACPRRAD